ncbi:hypothetical protein [Cognatilysobacter lacus]|uniref:Uncharacterized protein n=1 Tax=Cognatilysobacter lacus TaxID=1643323 RepID=A0A5D8Z6K5_9GAMM|nr:hypothetical protein [Lysobacter lacus]TZF90327.1 hypothetical protein FW784_05770 [Lysobacter lacus]
MFWSTIAVGVAGLLTLGIAVAVAASRYRRCGASSLDAVDSACRLGAQFLSGAYVLLSLALVLGAASLTLLWRARRKLRQR